MNPKFLNPVLPRTPWKSQDPKTFPYYERITLNYHSLCRYAENDDPVRKCVKDFAFGKFEESLSNSEILKKIKELTLLPQISYVDVSNEARTYREETVPHVALRSLEIDIIDATTSQPIHRRIVVKNFPAEWTIAQNNAKFLQTAPYRLPDLGSRLVPLRSWGFPCCIAAQGRSSITCRSTRTAATSLPDGGTKLVRLCNPDYGTVRYVLLRTGQGDNPNKLIQTTNCKFLTGLTVIPINPTPNQKLSCANTASVKTLLPKSCVIANRVQNLKAVRIPKREALKIIRFVQKIQPTEVQKRQQLNDSAMFVDIKGLMEPKCSKEGGCARRNSSEDVGRHLALLNEATTTLMPCHVNPKTSSCDTEVVPLSPMASVEHLKDVRISKRPKISPEALITSQTDEREALPAHESKESVDKEGDDKTGHFDINDMGDIEFTTTQEPDLRCHEILMRSPSPVDYDRDELVDDFTGDDRKLKVGIVLKKKRHGYKSSLL